MLEVAVGPTEAQARAIALLEESLYVVWGSQGIMQRLPRNPAKTSCIVHHVVKSYALLLGCCSGTFFKLPYKGNHN